MNGTPYYLIYLYWNVMPSCLQKFTLAGENNKYPCWTIVQMHTATTTLVEKRYFAIQIWLLIHFVNRMNEFLPPNTNDVSFVGHCYTPCKVKKTFDDLKNSKYKKKPANNISSISA